MLLTLFAAPAPAHADYHFCNETSYVLDGAIARAAGPMPESRGWLRLMPGACASMLGGKIEEGDDYHIFARSMDAHQGPIKYFSGNEAFCILDRDFHIEGREQCALRGYDTANFLHVKTRAGNDWTTSFTEAGEYTPEQARIAGVQRLLKDAGFSISRIDGYAARNTSRAIEAFQRSIGTTVSGRITDTLLDQLVVHANSLHDTTGLSLCNRTDELVWAAIAYQNSEDEMSNGWIRIEAGTCRKAIRGKLGDGPYYIYAEALDKSGAVVRRGDKSLVWGGVETFCTKPTRFEIRGREDCIARGFDERKFRLVKTDGEARKVIDLD